jgi:hypothetical protein
MIKIVIKMTWYKITALKTHVGARKRTKKQMQYIYIWDNDIINVLDRYKKLGGVGRNDVPEIEALTDEESSKLEKAILEELGMKLKNAKKRPIRYYQNAPPV